MQFRTKARAVDLLGKGQIADLPTAITELWKNGYDAYADNLTAQIYLKGYKDMTSPIFVITDDGKGMSRNDIFERWLVLGTDSKSRITLQDKESEETLWKKPRVKAGEKGIGRLSVAFLGNPMLMLTKKQGHPLQALFFDWRLLENYNLFLDDVDIPVESINDSEGFVPTFDNLKQVFLSNFDRQKDESGQPIWEEKQLGLKNEIINTVNQATLPPFLLEKSILDLIDIENDHGTKFIVFNPINQILELTSKSEDDLEDIDFVSSSLSGFTNDFIKDNKLINTSMPVFDSVGDSRDFLGQHGNFFTHEDYKLADIVIDGKLDGSGKFEGKVTIYDEVIDYSMPIYRRKDTRSEYGEVPLKIAYSQGKEKESKFGETAYKKINDKVSAYGGIYIYRDNFRVLPYGRPNYDFLNIEERRSKRAGTAFFSYRRMFGYIDISRDRNEHLKDKSSREGLINNARYRAFRRDLENLLTDLAKTFFSDRAVEPIFLDRKKQIKDQKQAIAEDAKRSIQEKKEFSRSLKAYPNRLKNYQEEYLSTLKTLEEKVSARQIVYSDLENLMRRLSELDVEFENLIPKIPKRYRPTETQLDRLRKYEVELADFNKTIKTESTTLMSKVKEQLDVKELKIDFTKNYQVYRGALEELINENKSALQIKYDKIFEEFASRSQRVLADLDTDKARLLESVVSKESVNEFSGKLKNKFEFLRDQINRELVPLIEHLKKLSFDIDEELLQGAYKAEYDSIKYKWEQTRETAQLGIAVEIIDHEFNQLYAKINNSLSKLEPLEALSQVEDFDFLKKNFKQLENKYELLSPLYRISGVVAQQISGKRIFDYLKKFFDRRINDYDIELNATEAYLSHSINIKEPVIHTVYINIINNAIYWMRNVEKRQILLDYNSNTNEIIICNSGIKIEEQRLEKIFDIFYSNRPNGRGIGLYLSKQSLNESDFDIYATNNEDYNVLNGACFVIKSIYQ